MVQYANRHLQLIWDKKFNIRPKSKVTFAQLLDGSIHCCCTVFSWTKKYHIIIQLCSTVLAEFNHVLVHTNSSRDNEISTIDSHRTAIR